MAAEGEVNKWASKVQRILAGAKREQFERDATARHCNEVLAFAKMITGFKKAPAAAKYKMGQGIYKKFILDTASAAQEMAQAAASAGEKVGLRADGVNITHGAKVQLDAIFPDPAPAAPGVPADDIFDRALNDAANTDFFKSYVE
jgi:hypothetical protein